MSFSVSERFPWLVRDDVRQAEEAPSSNMLLVSTRWAYLLRVGLRVLVSLVFNDCSPVKNTDPCQTVKPSTLRFPFEDGAGGFRCTLGPGIEIAVCRLGSHLILHVNAKASRHDETMRLIRLAKSLDFKTSDVITYAHGDRGMMHYCQGVLCATSTLAAERRIARFLARASHGSRVRLAALKRTQLFAVVAAEPYSGSSSGE